MLLRWMLCCFLLLPVFLKTNEVYAEIYDGPRSGIDYSNDICSTGEFKFNPITENKDVFWDLARPNPICMGFVAGYGYGLHSAGKFVDRQCIPQNSYGVPKSPAEQGALRASPSSTALTATTGKKILINASQCTSRAVEYTTMQAAFAAAQCGTVNAATPTCSVVSPTPPRGLTQDVALAATDLTRCCSAYAAYMVIVGTYTAALATIWDTAKIAFENARICGARWNSWGKDESGKWVKGKGRYQRCVNQLFTNNGIVNSDCADFGIYSDSARIRDANPSLTNKYFREFYYGGEEFIDNGSGACRNPSVWSSSEKRNYLGYSDSEQRYYMTGAGSTPVFACNRFLPRKDDSVDDIPNIENAYDCCVKRGQEVMCIQNKQGIGDIISPYKTQFCKKGEFCSVANVIFEVYDSRETPNYLCAKTYSVCPYNHLLGGGTEKQEFYPTDDPNHIAETKNFCQYMKHCVKTPIKPYFSRRSLDGAFISSACRDLKGDSQNNYGYNSQLLQTHSRNFSAPIAQCFKETMENIFLNKAGDDACNDAKDSPAKDCPKSGFAYKKGEDLPTKSFFIKIQDSLQSIIKLGLIVAVMMFGFKLLMAVPGTKVTKKELLPFILKIALVMYFAIGDGWQQGFMEGVIGSSNFLSELTFNPDEEVKVIDKNTVDKGKLDGCQFPRYNYADDNIDTSRNDAKYPPGKGYLRIFDTLDCKIVRALGYGPGVSVPNILLMAVGGFFTGGAGIFFVMVSFLAAFLMVAITLRALHMFLLSITAIVMLMWVSPMMIVLAMFAKTKSIFDGWWKQMLGFALQPMILFAYLGILISFIDSTVIGDVNFKGSTKIIDGITVLNEAGDAPKDVECNDESRDTSIYCIFRIAKLKTYHGLEAIGIGIPMLESVNKTQVQSLFKIMVLLFIFLSFLDNISDLAKELVGGASLSSNWGGAKAVADLAGKAAGAMYGIQERVVRGSLKWGGKAGRAGIEKMREMGNKGKYADSDPSLSSTRKEGGRFDDVSREGVKSDNVMSSNTKSDNVVTSDGEKWKPSLSAIPEGDESEDEDSGVTTPESGRKGGSEGESGGEKWKPSLSAIPEGDESEDENSDSEGEAPTEGGSEAGSEDGSSESGTPPESENDEGGENKSGESGNSGGGETPPSNEGGGEGSTPPDGGNESVAPPEGGEGGEKGIDSSNSNNLVPPIPDAMPISEDKDSNSDASKDQSDSDGDSDTSEDLKAGDDDKWKPSLPAISEDGVDEDAKNDKGEENSDSTKLDAIEEGDESEGEDSNNSDSSDESDNDSKHSEDLNAGDGEENTKEDDNDDSSVASQDSSDQADSAADESGQSSDGDDSASDTSDNPAGGDDGNSKEESKESDKEGGEEKEKPSMSKSSAAKSKPSSPGYLKSTASSSAKERKKVSSEKKKDDFVVRGINSPSKFGNKK